MNCKARATAYPIRKRCWRTTPAETAFPIPPTLQTTVFPATRFDRPGFTAMMEEVEAGRVEAVIIKDMSRLGRDYLKVGQIMEILRQKRVRLIAINDGVDSLKGDDDFTPFRNIMNEFYARDTSRKIKSVFKAKGHVRQAYLQHHALRLSEIAGGQKPVDRGRGSRRRCAPHLRHDDGGLRPVSDFKEAYIE